MTTHKRERERKRESKIKRLKKRIAKLEAKTNRTAEEEQELQEKRKELEQLERENQVPNNYGWVKPVLIGGGVILVVGLVTWLVISQSKRKPH